MKIVTISFSIKINYNKSIFDLKVRKKICETILCCTNARNAIYLILPILSLQIHEYNSLKCSLPNVCALFMDFSHNLCDMN